MQSLHPSPPLGLVPKLFETFMAVRALARFTECSLLLWRVSTNGRKWAKQVRNRLARYSLVPVCDIENAA